MRVNHIHFSGFGKGAGFFILTFFCLFLAVGGPASSYAQPATACDPEYMDALEARAFLEAQREIVQNQNLIFKPDSVLEYTCFDKMVNHLAAQDLFSGAPTTTLLASTVGQTLNDYLNKNYDHPFLNNRTKNGLDADLEDGGNEGFTTKIDGVGSYTCDLMAKVWSAAKNMNFMNDEDGRDGFYDFYSYASEDPRDKIASYANITKGTPSPHVERAAAAAFNNDEASFILPSGTEKNTTATMFDSGTASTTYTEDPVVTHLDKILPPGAAVSDGTPGGTTNVSCGHRIPTGITVAREGAGNYEEYVCTNPGCSYDPSDGACKP